MDPDMSAEMAAPVVPEDPNEFVDYELLEELDGNFANENVDAENYIFWFTGVFYQRFYRNQMKFKEWTRSTICGNDITEVLDSIWAAAFEKIERQVIFDDGVPRWSDQIEPTINDISEYITLQDPQKKKVYPIETLTSRVLSGFRNKNIKIYVYPYSNNVESSAEYKDIQSKLLSPKNADRAGAHSVQEDSELADELKKKNTHLTGHNSSWRLWANLIHSSPANRQEEMKKSCTPPMQLAKYFRWVPSSEEGRMEAMHHGMIMAQHNNSGWLKEIGNVRQIVLDTRNMLDGVLCKLDELERRGSVSSEIYSSMETALRPEETEVSNILAHSVTDCFDEDHN